MYYGETTILTIGYGDYYPVTDKERVLNVIWMFIGAALYSYFMNSFIYIIN